MAVVHVCVNLLLSQPPNPTSPLLSDSLQIDRAKTAAELETIKATLNSLRKDASGWGRMRVRDIVHDGV